ncbi:MAG: pilus assembly protein [Lachnospiraceae bacterium]|nr:pilus assembly protein [Lachnospiraceae bacterium]
MFFTSAFDSFKNNKHSTLPVSMHVFITRPVQSRERTILNASSVRASLTVEAALILPFFVLALLSLIYLINIMALYTTLQIRLEETARKINSSAYIYSNLETSLPDSNIIASEIIRSLFMSQDIKKSCRISHIKNGENGIFFYHSKIDKADTADIVITYYISVPFISKFNLDIPVAQRCSFKLFTGNHNIYDNNNKDSIVYMTAHGTVYHTNKYCSYLIKYAEILDKVSLFEYETASHRKFSLCSACEKNFSAQNTPVIYISKTGSVYHYSRDCYYLTSHIYECYFKDIEKHYALCSRCSELSNEDKN